MHKSDSCSGTRENALELDVDGAEDYASWTSQDVFLETPEQNGWMEAFVNFDAADDDDFDFNDPFLLLPDTANNAPVSLSVAWPNPTSSTYSNGLGTESSQWSSPWSVSDHVTLLTPKTSPGIAPRTPVAASERPPSKETLPPLLSRAKCLECNKTFVDSLQLGRHAEKCRLSQIFKCDLCPTLCAEARSLERHVRNIHKKVNLFACECTPNKLRRDDNFKRHKEKCRISYVRN